MPHKIFGVVLTGFALGVFLGSFIDFSLSAGFLFVFIAIVFLLLFWFKKLRVFLFFGLSFLSLGLGVLRYETINHGGNKAILEEKADQKVSLIGVIVSEPEEKENYKRFVFESETNKILIYSQKYPDYKYGDQIKISGVLKKPEEFNLEAYLAKDDIYYEAFYPKIDFISSNSGLAVKKILFGIKEKFLSAVGTAVPEPNASFLGGLTIGARESLPKNLQDDFKKTGVVHIVALSGYNITIIAEAIMLILSFLPRYFAVSGGVAGIVLFAIMTGASSTVLRASIMALIALGAKTSGRIYTASWALFLAGFFMILQNPKILRFDMSFQLSFLATVGLIYFSPVLQNKLSFVTERFKLREIFSATMSAQIFVLPLLVYKTGNFSLIGLLVNFLILPFIPSTMFFGFATGILGIIGYSISVPFGWAAYALSQYELWTINIFARIPLASINIPNFYWGVLVLAYVFLLLLIIFSKNKIKINKKI